jgi:hypothetical protein
MRPSYKNAIELLLWVLYTLAAVLDMAIFTHDLFGRIFIVLLIAFGTYKTKNHWDQI